MGREQCIRIRTVEGTSDSRRDAVSAIPDYLLSYTPMPVTMRREPCWDRNKVARRYL